MLCRVMQVSVSAYYDWCRISTKQVVTFDIVQLESRVKALFSESRQSMGSRKMSHNLKQEGFAVGRYKARKLMQKLNLVVRCKQRFVKTTDSNHNFNIAPNILDRQFNPPQPNQVWTTDITYIKTKIGWIYLAVVIDLYARQIIGWAVKDSMETELCCQALRMAYWRRKPDKGIIHHSDRGSQYASHEYQNLLKEYGMQCSMSRKGNCYDNAPTERFFRSLKQERIYGLSLHNLQHAKIEILDYITWYNSKRLHQAIDYKTPLDFEKLFHQNAA